MVALLAVGCSNNSDDAVNPVDSSVANCWGHDYDPDPDPECPAVTSAVLHLYLIQENYHPVNIHRITAPWDETTITWNSFNGAYDATVLATFDSDLFGWKDIDVTTLVQMWSDGDYDNFGMLLDQVEEEYPRSIFYAKENGEYIPYLTVSYDDGTSVDIEVLQDAYIWLVNPDDNMGTRHVCYTGWEFETDLEKQAMLQFELPVCEPEEEDGGCTRTIGYWKNHAGFGPQDDEVTPLLPIWLGDENGAKSLYVDNAEMARNILAQWTYGWPGNGITKLYAQLLAAKLNIASGASDNAVEEVITQADAFLAEHDFTDWRQLHFWTKSNVLYWKGQLDSYNNGWIGPGHCDDNSGGGGCGGGFPHWGWGGPCGH